MRVRVDAELCQATGMCTGLVPEVFGLGDRSTAEVLVPEPAELDASVRDAVLEAVRSCPVGAVSVED